MLRDISANCFYELFGNMVALQVLVSAFLAILFLQSGIDKVWARKDNLDWLKGHFSNSIFKSQVPLLLALLTALELCAGSLSAIGVFEVIFSRTFCAATLGTLLSGLTLFSLFMGQRVAKDYAGAASLVPYFVLVIIDLFLLLG